VIFMWPRIHFSTGSSPGPAGDRKEKALRIRGFIFAPSLRLHVSQRRQPVRKRKDLCRAAKVSLELAFPATPGPFGPS
jgi:hypothetical protein